MNDRLEAVDHQPVARMPTHDKARVPAGVSDDLTRSVLLLGGPGREPAQTRKDDPEPECMTTDQPHRSLLMSRRDSTKTIQTKSADRSSLPRVSARLADTVNS